MTLVSSFLLVVENKRQQFLDFCYFVVVTMSTVGFGDVYPITELGRLCVVVMIITMLAVIPAKVEALSKVLN